MTFHVGQRVVCIDQDWVGGFGGVTQFPVKGCVYEVRGFAHTCDVGDSIFLCEVVNPLCQGICRCGYGQEEYSFLVEHFRPVKDTSIKCFTDMLAPVEPEKIEETV